MTENLLPAFFEPELATHYGTDIARLIVDGCFASRATTLRANTLLSSREEVASILDEAEIAHTSPTWYPDAFVLTPDMESAIWNLPAFKEGKLYLQSLSSMIPPLVMDSCTGLDVLDMCAAPGGKTTELAALNNAKARITACELNAPRAEKLEYNLRRQGASNVTVMRTDARRLDSFFSFDRIMLDAPCSGSGTLDGNSPKTAKRFTEALIAKSSKNQRALLQKALEILKPGGTLVYSTCSILPQENCNAVHDALKRASKRGKFEIVPIELPGATYCGPANPSASSPDCLPILPSALEGTLTLRPTELFEGFFVAKLKKLA